MSSGTGPAGGDPGPSGPLVEGVTAVVLTFMRPRLAGDVTRALLDGEGFPGDRVVVVVNGSGGLDDAALEDSVRMLRLPRNTGPAGGFRAGMEAVFADPGVRWAYLCEDDVGLFSLPVPRLASVLERLERFESVDRAHRPVGAVVSYGRRFVGRGSHTVNVVPPPESPGPDGSAGDLVPVDVACWGATLVSRAVVDAGVLPDPDWFFGLEDFDFFCRVREAGFDVLVDGVAARAVADQQTSSGREAAISTARPNDADEAWRAYYHARNSLALARRHGRPSWYGWQALYAARSWQTARSSAERRAIVDGVWDGLRGRTGEDPRYGRRVGEFGPSSAR